MHAVFANDFLQTFKSHEGFRSFFNDTDVPGQLTGRHPLNQSLYLWTKTRLPNYLLTVLGDRMEMAHSIEVVSRSSTIIWWSSSAPNL